MDTTTATTSATTSPAQGYSLPSRSRAAVVRGLAGFIVFTTWIISGLVLDGWSHNRSKPETFFTPWHAVLYSGFFASVLWSVIDSTRNKRDGVEPVLIDRWSRLGVATFTIGMVSDFAWHEILGIERGIEALLSPTHLLLMIGGLLLVTTPLRAAGSGSLDGIARSWRTAGATVSTAGAAVLTGFFTMELSAFRASIATFAVSVPGVGGAADDRIALGVGSVLITTLVVVGAALALTRLADPAPGAITALLVLFATAMSALDSFHLPALIAAAAIAGALSEGARLRVGPAAAAVIPLTLWPAWFLALRLQGTMLWSAPLWSGTAVLATLLGLALTFLPTAPRPSTRTGVGGMLCG